MSYVPYKSCDEKWYWRGPEALFRDFDGNTTKDETNANTGVFWNPPVFIGVENPVYIRKLKAFSKYQSGNRYYTMINHDGYKEILLTFTGPVIDRSWLYYLTDACTTTDNSPSSGKYTHVYVNTATHTNPPKSFELLHKVVNDTSAESVLELFTGCVIVSYTETASVENPICQGTWVVKASNIITGTALTSPGYPAANTLNFMNFANAALTWTKGGTALNGYFKGYTFTFSTDRDIIKEGNSYYAVASRSPNKIEASLKVTWMPSETDSYDDSQDDPLTALNKDVTLKISRNTTNDYFSIALVDCFQELVDPPAWTNNNLYEIYDFWINPHEATPSTITLTEVNALDDDRYET